MSDELFKKILRDIEGVIPELAEECLSKAEVKDAVEDYVSDWIYEKHEEVEDEDRRALAKRVADYWDLT